MSEFTSKLSFKTVYDYQEKLIPESPKTSTNDTEFCLEDITKAIFSIYIQSSKIKVRKVWLVVIQMLELFHISE